MKFEDYPKLDQVLAESPEQVKFALYWVLARSDLFFLLRNVLSTRNYKDESGQQAVHKRFIFDRCREVQDACDGYIDIWARYHWKSTIKTFGEVIRRLLNNPDITFGVFSHTRPIAKQFLRQIKIECESNELLRRISWSPLLGDQIIPEEPRKNTVKWSEDDGIIVNRTTNSREATVEAWGLVDSYPAGKHFLIRVYDDAVSISSVNTPEQINKTIQAWELSLALGIPGGEEWYTGTFYSHDDPYHEMIRRGVKWRLYPCYQTTIKEEDIDVDTRLPIRMQWDFKDPVLLEPDALHVTQEMMGSKTFAIQMLCDPNAMETVGFKREWIQYYQNPRHEERYGKNVYITVDPANAKKKDSDYTAMWVVGLGPDKNFYVLDALRDRMNLQERTAALFNLHRKWKPLEVRYEQYGLMADIQYIKEMMERKNYRFRIRKVAGRVNKDDRISRLVPAFKEERFYFPRTIPYNKRGMIREFLNDEFLKWPNCKYKDMLDSLARLFEPDEPLQFPDHYSTMIEVEQTDRWARAFREAVERDQRTPKHTWMGA